MNKNQKHGRNVTHMKNEHNEVKLDKVNIVNKKFYENDVEHTITMPISNAINPTFTVYAPNLQDAMDELAVYLVKHKLVALYHTWDELHNNENPEDNIEEYQEDSFYQADNGVYLDMERIYSETKDTPLPPEFR
jgi:hypothetical protein